jgi:hypothetical protein
MKKILLIVAIGVALSCGLLMTIPSVRDELRWQQASWKKQETAYRQYLKAYPEGAHRPDALRRIEELNWQQAVKVDTLTAYTAFRDAYKDGHFKDEAERRIEELTWQQAVKAGTLAAYIAYRDAYKDGRFKDQAQRRIEELSWEQALKADILTGYDDYLRLFASGPHNAEALLRREDVIWRDAVKADTLTAYIAYRDAYTDGRFKDQAQRRIEELSWQQAVKTNTLAGYDAYLQMFASGPHNAEALLRREDVIWDRICLRSLGGSRSVSDQVSDVREYITAYPAGRHIQEAKTMLRKLETNFVSGNAYWAWAKASISGLEVSISRISDAKRYETATDADGNYYFEYVEPGKYSMTISWRLPGAQSMPCSNFTISFDTDFGPDPGGAALGLSNGAGDNTIIKAGPVWDAQAGRHTKIDIRFTCK